MKIFAQRLRQVRLERGFPAVEVAKKAGISKQALSNLEAGLNYPSVPVLLALAGVLEASIDYLLDFGGANQVTGLPKGLADLAPDLASLNRSGQEAVRALVKGLAKGS